ncbi:MAG: hypothetical protein Q4D65_06825 [Peptostreptococcaceae bacterium]|nr:hypothetical protein [Peptostreptococcaceae bacterium]
MIFKLFKYDCRGVGKKLLPLYVLTLAFAVMARFSLSGWFNRFQNIEYSSQYEMSVSDIVFNAFASLTIGISWLLIFAVFFVTFFIIVIKYGRSVFGEEGYLTNTLPITSSQIIITKVLNYYLWNFVATVVVILALIIMYLHTDIIPFTFEEAWDGVVRAYQMIPPDILSKGYFLFFLFLLSMIISPITYILLVYFSIGIGSQFKNKFIMSIVAYFGVSFVIGQITNIPMSLYFVSVGERLEGAGDEALSVMIMVAIMALITVIASGIFYFFGTKYFMDKKLNLE